MLPTPKRLKGPTPAHVRSRSQESETAKRVNGKLTKASGAQAEKGDVRLKGFVRIEAKTTAHSSFSVTKEMVEKIENAAAGAGEIPVIVIELELGAVKVAVMPDWALEWIAATLQSE
jgi:hypothetical protein